MVVSFLKTGREAGEPRPHRRGSPAPCLLPVSSLMAKVPWGSGALPPPPPPPGSVVAGLRTPELLPPERVRWACVVGATSSPQAGPPSARPSRSDVRRALPVYPCWSVSRSCATSRRRRQHFIQGRRPGRGRFRRLVVGQAAHHARRTDRRRQFLRRRPGRRQVHLLPRP